MRLRYLLLAALLLAATVLAAAFVSLPFRATVTSLTGYCLDVEPQLQRIAGAERHRYRPASGRSLYLHIFRPPPGKDSGTTMMLFFGGGWREGSITALEAFAQKLARDGHVVILPDYRVRCRDGSSIADSVEDARAAYGWVLDNARTLRIDPEKVVLGGESAGGHLAVMAALGSADAGQPAALLLFNPVVDLVALSTQLWIPAEAARQQSPMAKPLDGLPPTLILHGAADQRVPIASVRRFCAKAVRAGRSCSVAEHVGMDHGFFHSRQPVSGNESAPFDRALGDIRCFLIEQSLVPEAAHLRDGHCR